MISVNIFHSGKEMILAACDEELLGKTFREGKKRLQVSEGFYGGHLVEAPEFLVLLKEVSIANLTGERTVKEAVEGGFIDQEHILMVDGIPHAQMARYMV